MYLINERKKLFKELPFYIVSIDKPKIKKLTNVEMLRELPFYDDLNIVQTVTAFKNYSRSYKIEIMKDKDGNVDDPLVQLEANKPVIKDLFRDLLIEMKGFKYQVTQKVKLSKQKQNGVQNFQLFLLILL